MASDPTLAPEPIRRFLEASGFDFEVIECDPELADTDVFCAHYGYAPEDSANTIVVKTKTGEEKFVACLVLASTRLDVNKRVRKKLQARKVSFASHDEARALTGMEPGGVTALGLPGDLPLWVDARVMARPRVILGGGNRDCKIICPPALLETLPQTEVVDGLAVDRD